MTERKMKVMSQEEINEVTGKGIKVPVCKCKVCDWVVLDNWLGRGGHDLVADHKGKWIHYYL